MAVTNQSSSTRIPLLLVANLLLCGFHLLEKFRMGHECLSIAETTGMIQNYRLPCAEGRSSPFQESQKERIRVL